MRTPALYTPFLRLPPSPFPQRLRGPAEGAVAQQLAGGQAAARPVAWPGPAQPGSAQPRRSSAGKWLKEFPSAPAWISEGSPAGAGTFLFALAKPKVIQFALITTISPELSPDSDRRSL